MTGRARKGVKSGTRYLGLALPVLHSKAFQSLTPWVRALYVDLRRQYNGYNNGDIAATDSILNPLGWPHSTIHKGLKMLIEHGLLVQTRQGGIGAMNRTCSLYAFTDLPVFANPKKGIAKQEPSLAYRYFNPPAKPAAKRSISETHRNLYEARRRKVRTGSAVESAGSDIELSAVQGVTARAKQSALTEPTFVPPNRPESRANAR